MKNAYKNTRIEYHILQSFPVTCLNRDAVGAPKTAVVGGVSRARVSSQCWKRDVRLSLHDFGVILGIRTKKAAEIFTAACAKEGASADEAESCGKKMADLLVDDTLLFISGSEAEAFAKYAKEHGFSASNLKDKDLGKIAKRSLSPAVDALDIALFGRMVAKATDMKVEAAASFSHAISTHKVSNEIDFFTALDDLADEPGSAHMGSIEFNSATYYRYISLDLGQLSQTLGEDQLREAVEAFTKALFVAVPSARQTTQSGASPWDFASIMVRKGQRLQVPFERPIQARGEGFLAPSVAYLKDYLIHKESVTGSLFGKIAGYEWGEDDKFSIDDLVSSLKRHI